MLIAAFLLILQAHAWLPSRGVSSYRKIANTWLTSTGDDEESSESAPSPSLDWFPTTMSGPPQMSPVVPKPLDNPFDVAVSATGRRSDAEDTTTPSGPTSPVPEVSPLDYEDSWLKQMGELLQDDSDILDDDEIE